MRRPPSGPAAPWWLRAAPHALAGALIAGLLTAWAVRPGIGTVPTCAAVCAAAGAAGGVALARGRPGPALGLVALTLVAAGLGWGAWRLDAAAPPRLAVPATVTGTVVLEAPPRPRDHGGSSAFGAAARLASGGGVVVPAGTRLLVELAPGVGGAARGAVLRVTGRLRAAAGDSAPGWWRAYLDRRGVGYRLDVRSGRVVGERGGLPGVIDGWRRVTERHVAAGLSGDRREVVRGMALGDGGRLSDGAEQDFRDAGLWHLLAVSGQNVGVVAIAVLAALRALGVARRPAVAGAGLVLVAYCLACDGGASVVRAGVAGGLGLLAELRSAPRERWHLLLAGLAALLMLDPVSIMDPGLQLSFAAVVGLFVIAPPVAGRLEGLCPPRAAALVAQAAAAGLATAPVLAARFGELSLVGLVVNVVAVPLAAPIVVLALAGLAAGAVVPFTGVALAAAAGVGAETLLILARAAAALPWATVVLPAWSAVPLAGLAAAPVLAVRLLERPGRPRRADRGRAAPAAALAAVLAAAVAVWPARGAPWPVRADLTMLDVGQGQAVLLRDPSGAAVLVDTGPDGDPPAVLAGLARAGVDRLAALVVSHGQADHAGAVEALLATLPVGVVVHGPPGPDDPGLGTVRRTAAAAGVPSRAVVAGDELVVGGWRLDVRWPRPGPWRGDPNARSVVLHATTRGLGALVPGDAESPILLPLGLPRADVLAVPHHGSADPGLPALLRRVAPTVALVSSGEGNRFGHPAPQTLRALREAGVPVRRTDGDGDLRVMAGG